MRSYQVVRVFLCALPFWVSACGGCSKSQEPAQLKFLGSLGLDGVEATCSANKLTVAGKYTMGGREGDLLLLVDSQECARFAMKEAARGVPFTLEATGLGAGQHEWQLWFDGTILTETRSGERAMHPSRTPVGGLPQKIVCN